MQVIGKMSYPNCMYTKKSKLLISSVLPANFIQVKLIKMIIIVLKRSMSETRFGKSDQRTNTDIYLPHKCNLPSNFFATSSLNLSLILFETSSTVHSVNCLEAPSIVLTSSEMASVERK